MSFVRPELVTWLTRWRDAIAGAGVALFGIVWAFGARGFMAWLGLPVLILGAALVWLGWQRGRFRNDGDGPGVVSIAEGRIAYFGPLTGGAIDTEAISRIALDRTGQPAHWALTAATGETLYIPVTARGADALIDALAGLPGFRTGAAVAALSRRGAGVTVVWQRPGYPTPPTLPDD